MNGMYLALCCGLLKAFISAEPSEIWLLSQEVDILLVETSRPRDGGVNCGYV